MNVHIFQPGGYFVRTETSALGMYAALMPTGPTEIYFTKELRTTRNLSIEVRDNIQVGAWDLHGPICLGTNLYMSKKIYINT